MANSSQFLHLLYDIQEPIKLHHGVFLTAVGIGEMGKDSLGMKTRESDRFRNLLGRLCHVGLVTQKTQPGHAGVTLDMDCNGSSRALGFGRKGFGIGQVVAGLGDVILHEFFPIEGRGTSQDQDRRLDSRLPKFNRLVQAGDPQIVRPQLFQLLCHRDSAMAIGICLNQPHKLGSIRSQLTQRVVVVGQFFHGYLSPSPFLL